MIDLLVGYHYCGFILRQAQDEAECSSEFILMVSLSNHGQHRFSSILLAEDVHANYTETGWRALAINAASEACAIRRGELRSLWRRCYRSRPRSFTAMSAIPLSP